jgi:hypothetical protein
VHFGLPRAIDDIAYQWAVSVNLRGAGKEVSGALELFRLRCSEETIGRGVAELLAIHRSDEK